MEVNNILDQLVFVSRGHHILVTACSLFTPSPATCQTYSNFITYITELPIYTETPFGFNTFNLYRWLKNHQLGESLSASLNYEQLWHCPPYMWDILHNLSVKWRLSTLVHLKDKAGMLNWYLAERRNISCKILQHEQTCQRIDNSCLTVVNVKKILDIIISWHWLWLKNSICST